MVDADYFGHASRIAVSAAFGRGGETLELHSGWKPEPGVDHLELDELARRTARCSCRAVTAGRRDGDRRADAIAVEPCTVWVAHVGARR